MKEIGLKLKERRESLGLSLDDMSIKTKIQPHYLKALEEGNTDFFKDDLSYLRYYLRFYCQALQIDFEEVREEFEKGMDQYTETISLNKIRELETKQQTINKRIQDSKGKMKPEKKKVDYSLISLILVIMIVVGGIGFFAVKVLPTMFQEKPQDLPLVTPIPSATPVPSTQPEETENPITQDKAVLQATTVDGINYELRGWRAQEQISIRVEFGKDTWMRVSYNGVASDNPTSKIYKVGEVMEILANAEAELKITIHFGLLKENKVYLNGVEYTLDERFKDLTTGQQIHFTLKGE